MSHPLKPPPLRPNDSVRVVSLSSPVDPARLDNGLAEISRLGYRPLCDRAAVLAGEGFFAGPASARCKALHEALAESESRAVVCTRGGYGVNYLLDAFPVSRSIPPKIFLGYSDLTSLHLFLWKHHRWVTFYGPMAAAGFDAGANNPHGYDHASFLRAITETKQGYSIPLAGQSIVSGTAKGILLGGCLTLLETSLGTPWEPDTRETVLLLEDRGMKPWQVDRALTHLRQAGKFENVSGILLGDFPDCEAPSGTETVEEVAERILSPLGVPLIWGVPVGHTVRPLITLPLGVRARLVSSSTPPSLELLEPPCAP
ncbi:MAG TPA: LD-carboxypeptidase [Candidatus Acidoferrum sp.]|nr:LD-carboxypeptidase [Candidatus Acidoferrum sp.]